MKAKLILAMLIMSAVACKKSETINKQPMVRRSLSSVMIRDSAANNINPYDSVGYWHNIILVGTLDKMSLTQTPDATKITPFIVSVTSDKMGVSLPASYFDTVTGTVADEPNNFQDILNKTTYSDHLKGSLSTLLKLINRLGESATDYNQVKNAISSYEQGVINDTGLSQNEKKVALISASVARYSYYYWSFKNPTAASLKARNIIKWIAAVTSDIGGGMISNSAAYAADCSSYAYWLVTYSMP